MTTTEFWDKYTNEDILDIFEETCEFFSEDLPVEFTDNYDVGEVILETMGHQVAAKNFVNALNFTSLLQKYQPDLYKEYFEYFDDFLIDYYCFQQEGKKVQEAFTNFIANPLHDIDQYLQSFKKLWFYQYTELLEDAVSKNFVDIDESEDLIGDASIDLSIFKLYQTLELYYNKGEGAFDKIEYSNTLLPYNFTMQEANLEHIVKSLFSSSLEVDELKKEFVKNRKRCLTIMQVYFQKHMLQKGFPFYLSGNIWYNMMRVWHEVMKNKKPDLPNYFNIKLGDFERHLTEQLDELFFDNLSKVCAILWGSVYVYEFLRKYRIISRYRFDSFMETSRKLKGKVIGNFTSDLWNSNFVHCWEKPKCISVTEFAEEEKIFKKSVQFQYQNFSELKGELSEELSSIGKLSDYINEGAEEENGQLNPEMYDDLFSHFLDDF